ncbi:MAG: hypothetical protein ABI720_04080 [Actinomycetes bacterium]
MRGGRSAVIVGQTILVGAALGVVMGVLWWWVAPTEQWVVSDAGLTPAEVGFTEWFDADAWFLVWGAGAGVLLTAISWRPGRDRPVALVLGIVVGAGVVALVAWAVGGALGAPDPQTVAETADVGTAVPGALGIRATAVLFAPSLTSLTVLALLLSNARLYRKGATDAHSATSAGVPQQIW